MNIVRKEYILDAFHWLGHDPSKPEDEIVRYYRHPDISGEQLCHICNYKIHDHGFIDNKFGYIVCPGNYVINSDNGYYPISKSKFEENFTIIPKSGIFENNFQERAYQFFLTCFKDEFPELVNDKVENQHRFIEESLELVQSLGMSLEEVIALASYVFNRPKGDPLIEAGGVATTYSILCKTHGIDVIEVSENELIRNYEIIDKIREKQRSKNKLNIKPILDSSIEITKTPWSI